MPVATLAVAPKCGLCLLAYAGLLGPELCGGSGRPDGLAVLLGLIGAGAYLLHQVMRRRSPAPP